MMKIWCEHCGNTAILTLVSEKHRHETVACHTPGCPNNYPFEKWDDNLPDGFCFRKVIDDGNLFGLPAIMWAQINDKEVGK